MKILRKIWQIWKRIGQTIGNWIARIVLTIFYFTIFPLFGLGVRLLTDPLAIKRTIGAPWLERATRDHTLDDARRLF